MKSLLLFIFLAATVSASPIPAPEAKTAPATVYSIPITSPYGGPSFLVGAWPNPAWCADMDGSFMYSHPFQCHFTGKTKDCGITGNGQAYPDGTPYPPPQTIPSNCVKSNSTMSGHHFLEYHALPTPGGSAPDCSELPKYQALANSDPAHYSVATVHKNCGGPCWPAQHDNACE